MNPNLAEEHLQTIRTLMERSALYRRELAPIMLLAGILGIAAAVVGHLCHMYTARDFSLLWLITASVVVAGAFMIARRQALKDKEQLWSAPTRRVAQALLPPFTAGLCPGLIAIWSADARDLSDINSMLVLLWMFLYGCALHSAGFFMPRGIKLFGWIYIILACFCLILMAGRGGVTNLIWDYRNANWLMGFFFGGLHLGYSCYLYRTEKQTSAA